MSDHTADWGFTRGLFAILVYDFNAPNGLLMSPTLWPLAFRFETHDLIIRGGSKKAYNRLGRFPTRLFITIYSFFSKSKVRPLLWNS